MIYAILGPGGVWRGVADYPDEAMDFAVRIANADRKDVTWTDQGAMHNRKVPTGWKIGRIV